MAETMHPDTPRNRGDHDAPHESPITPAEDARTIMLNKISWGAVFAGVVVALVTQFILNMFGIGLGAASLDPAGGAGANPAASTFSIGAGIWFVLSGVLASLAGGYAAGRLAGKPKESTGGWCEGSACGHRRRAVRHHTRAAASSSARPTPTSRSKPCTSTTAPQ